MNEIALNRAGVRYIVPDSKPMPLHAQMASERVPLLTQYLRVALRWKWVIAGIVAACVVAGLIVTLLMTPLYTASATIEISRETNKVVNIQGVAPESSPLDLEFFQTQYGLLRSRALAERVASDLRLQENARFFEMFGHSAFFEGRGSFKGRPDAKARIRKAGEILLDNIDVAPSRGSRLVDLRFTSPDPSLSAEVANAWASHFIQSSLERRFEATSYARKFLEDRLEQLRVKLEQSERQLVAYAARQKIINLPAQGGATGSASGERSLVADDLASLNVELARATADRVKAESAFRQATQNGGGATALSVESQGLAGLRQKRAELAAEYSKMTSQFEPGYPAARALAAQVAQLDRSIAREESRIPQSLRTAYQAAVEREHLLQARVDALQSNLLDLKRRSIQYNIYQRDVDTNRQLYDGLLQRYKEIGVAGGIGANNISVVDDADIPLKPSRPRLLANLLLALLTGIIVAAAATVALEQIDETITNPADVERELDLPLLGTIPKLREGDPLESLADRKSAIVDAYLAVQTYLELSTEHGVPKTISVASTRPGEGKSTTAYAVALLLARRGKRVVLIDGDMRSPSVHGMLGLPNKTGLSNYLAGDDQMSHLLLSAPQDGLFVLPAGPTPPNAAELLGGDRLSRLIEMLLTSHDHVVIDSPPVMGLADAALIASKVGGTLFTVESHGIRSSLVRVSIDRLRTAHARLLGIVLTKFEANRAHFGYGYEYGYGYGRDTSDED